MPIIYSYRGGGGRNLYTGNNVKIYPIYSFSCKLISGSSDEAQLIELVKCLNYYSFTNYYEYTPHEIFSIDFGKSVNIQENGFIDVCIPVYMGKSTFLDINDYIYAHEGSQYMEYRGLAINGVIYTKENNRVITEDDLPLNLVFEFSFNPPVVEPGHPDITA